MSDEDLKKIIGKPMSKSTVVVERGAVSNFATAVCDPSPVYRDPEAAKAAGLAAIPVPPTFPFVMTTWGEFPELQPSDKPTGNPMGEVIGPLMAKGGHHPPRRAGVRLPPPGLRGRRPRWARARSPTPTPRSPRARP